MTAYPKHFSYRLAVVSLVTTLLLAPALAQPSRDRIIKLVSWPREPIKIATIKVRGVRIEPGEKFQAEDDWLRGLTLSVTNISDKPICSINIALDFPRAENPDPPLREHLIFWCIAPSPGTSESSAKPRPLKPGQSMDIVLNDSRYAELKESLRQTDYPATINRLEIMVDEIEFEGEKDRKWAGGQVMRRDPDDPDRWYPVRP